MDNRETGVLSPDGFVRRWWAAGPFATPLRRLEAVLDDTGWAYAPRGRGFLSNVPQSLTHKAALYDRLSVCTGGTVQTIETVDPPTAGWYPVNADEQGVVDFGLFAFAPIHLRAWLSTSVRTDRPVTLTLRAPVVGPVVLLLDGEARLLSREFRYVEPDGAETVVDLSPGRHTLCLCGDMLVWREARLTLGLTVVRTVSRDDSSPTVTFEAPVGDESNTAEGLSQVVKSLEEQDRTIIATPAAILGTDSAREEPDFRMEPYGTQSARATEALRYLAAKDESPVSDLARVLVGDQTTVSERAIETACNHLDRRYDCADFFALWMHIVLNQDDQSPSITPVARLRIEDSLRTFKYQVQDPGIDAMCFFTENHQLIFHAAAYLSGTRFPDAEFPNSGRVGRRVAAQAREHLFDWISRKIHGGFSEWDSSAYLAMDAYALLTLVEFAPDQELAEAARELLDDVLMRIARQSWRGVHGSSHGRCYVNSLQSGRFDGTSGIQRICWGLGGFEGEHWATLMFAVSRKYSVPDPVVTEATDLAGVREVREHSAGRYHFPADLRDDSWSVHTITRKTSSYLLSAAVDHRPGDPGIQEHLWQATLGRDALVFTNYPANTSVAGHARPNFWAGSVRLPRVWMHGRTVVALYDLTSTVGLGRTHAHFPVEAFDEWFVDGPWAAARAGSGYVMLWSDGDLTLSAGGIGANRELVSTGGHAWVCRVGSAEEDESFSRFVALCRSDAPRHAGTGVICSDPDGATVELHRSGPCLVNGRVQSLWTERSSLRVDQTHDNGTGKEKRP